MQIKFWILLLALTIALGHLATDCKLFRGKRIHHHLNCGQKTHDKAREQSNYHKSIPEKIKSLKGS